ncbi:hypothetical protein PPERSA_07273 [Pseudocohnilembus persalinus]|uniref:Uncharacterized protein n=1 Tax=Pseudocohnilembus persalinus TaxID=266149 RepID=A0A0V0QD49_PSEPJ|nr:hypothetical protein PPERSA_07273 [Pseudocohnilembus persalinus]|eukprot:KRX00076.1 hypothetical protein PPERSA_07273 [Pseudocohnilembus persalinus]
MSDSFPLQKYFIQIKLIYKENKNSQQQLKKQVLEIFRQFLKERCMIMGFFPVDYDLKVEDIFYNPITNQIDEEAKKNYFIKNYKKIKNEEPSEELIQQFLNDKNEFIQKNQEKNTLHEEKIRIKLFGNNSFNFNNSHFIDLDVFSFIHKDLMLSQEEMEIIYYQIYKQVDFLIKKQNYEEILKLQQRINEKNEKIMLQIIRGQLSQNDIQINTLVLYLNQILGQKQNHEN